MPHGSRGLSPPFHDPDRLLQHKRHECFGRNFDRTAFGEDLCESAGPRSGSGANRRTLSLAGYSADDGAEGSASSDELCRPFIAADPGLPLLLKIRSSDGVLLPIDGYRL